MAEERQDNQLEPIYSSNNTALLQLLGRTCAGRVITGTDPPGCVSVLEISSGLKGPSPKLLPTSVVWIYCLVPEAPLIMGMSTGPKVFLAMPGACCFVPHLPVWWGVQ